MSFEDDYCNKIRPIRFGIQHNDGKPNIKYKVTASNSSNIIELTAYSIIKNSKKQIINNILSPQIICQRFNQQE